MEYGVNCLQVTLARRIRESGQALTGAALSGVLLCEGHLRVVGDRFG
jgi:hypothetical protein